LGSGSVIVPSATSVNFIDAQLFDQILAAVKHAGIG
jgi:hypothetical protein